MAEYFRDKGLNVILMMDSVTRFAMSFEGSRISRRGTAFCKRLYPKVFFTQLPKLLERAGTVEKSGSITGIYNVLVEGDDMTEPIADSVRSIVDGHIVLSRNLSQ